MMTVVKFDVMEYIWKWYQYSFWGENKSLSPNVSNQFSDIGYNNRNAFIALSTISIVIYYYLFRFVVSLLFKLTLKVTKNKNKQILAIYKIISNGIFFSLIFKVMIEGIIEILICSYLNYQTPKFNSIAEVLGASQSYFCLILIVIVMPIINVFVLIVAYKDISMLELKLFK